MRDWAAVVAAGTALPGVELATSYGRPALKKRGKTIAATTSPVDDSFVLHVADEEKQLLLDTAPDRFWQTDHYVGWPVVLVRYGPDADERVATLIARAWWDRATVAERKAAGNRP